MMLSGEAGLGLIGAGLLFGPLSVKGLPPHAGTVSNP